MKIIALKGKGGSGKTTTIHLLPKILMNNGYKQVPNSYQKHGADFIDIYTNGTNKIGITSRGDSYSIVYSDLDILIQQGCNICICACRTSDRKGKGTIAATKSFPSYKNIYIDKTYDKTSTQNNTNNIDANSIFQAI